MLFQEIFINRTFTLNKYCSICSCIDFWNESETKPSYVFFRVSQQPWVDSLPWVSWIATQRLLCTPMEAVLHGWVDDIFMCTCKLCVIGIIGKKSIRFNQYLYEYLLNATDLDCLLTSTTFLGELLPMNLFNSICKCRNLTNLFSEKLDMWSSGDQVWYFGWLSERLCVRPCGQLITQAPVHWRASILSHSNKKLRYSSVSWTSLKNIVPTRT